MRLAEEYDAAQDRGEVVGAHDGAKKRVDGNNAITSADLGIRRDEIHEARKLRDAEATEPGIVQRTLLPCSCLLFAGCARWQTG